MTTTSHTPGPWFFEPHNLYGRPPFEEGGEPWPFGYVSHNVVGTIRDPIFSLSPITIGEKSELEANACLIAAAPDLLAALKAMVDRDCEYHVNELRIPFGSHSEAIAATRTARAAIAKAEDSTL